MTRYAIALAVILALLAPVYAAAQPPSGTAPMTGMKPDRTTADPALRQRMFVKEQGLKRRRAACRRQAREQKIGLLKRRSFMRECMAR